MEGGGNAERACGCDTQIPVSEGCRLRIRMDTDEWALGEVLQIREISGTRSYFIRYLGITMREDEWVMEDRLDPNDVDCPRAAPVPISGAPVESGNTASQQTRTGPDGVVYESLTLDQRLPVIPAYASLGRVCLHDKMPTRQQNIRMIELGKYRIRPLYYSPYPEMFEKVPCMYICEFCLKPSKSRRRLAHHLAKCGLRHPPGKEIYREESISFFEVDGHVWKKYAHNLCLLGKLFLPHRTAGHCGPDWFIYYVLTHSDSHGCHIMGYFNRVKEPYAYVHRCTSAVTLPPYKDMGCGKLLADFTYKLFPLDAHLRLMVDECPMLLAGSIFQSHWSETLLDHLVDIEPPRAGGTRPVVAFKAAHKGQFLFSCGACGQSVCVASNISHLGEWDNRQPFLCQYCGESFVRLANLSTLKCINPLVTKLGIRDGYRHVPNLSQTSCQKC
ncbi:histone acetyltransferase Tip60-like isoform X1 [Schistocerca piceifrons]|uniref:histone acetyltransferase Tip60-like isoform X1 n=1 Tax=Schistocerca piceifrons TaxID=274613 RepID=UPI001F5F5162|nr:histone acetyltransferase Tip60-like isoform X1 [Schistocerca piceifrons]